MEYYAGLFIMIIIGGTAYVTIMRARRWQHQRKCQRCGAPDPTETVGPMSLCSKCAIKKVHSHRFAYRFFLGISILTGMLMTIGTLSDIQNGTTINWMDTVLMFLTGVSAPLSLAHLAKQCLSDCERTNHPL